MAHKKVIFFSLTASLLLISVSFLSKKDRTLNLHYTINYSGDNWQKNKTGFLWALSYLGAELPKGSFDKSITWQDSATFNINFDKLGFSEKALSAIEGILDSLKNTEQYQKTKRTDLGHFVAITIGCSWHYYAITGASKTYDDFLKEHPLIKEQRFFVTHSTVAKHNRLLKFKAAEEVLNSVYIAEEGILDSNSNSFTPKTFEVLDVMPNGQLRFAIYDEKGKLTDASPLPYGEAGKPAKCLWCHEIVFQPLYVKNDSVPGYMSPMDFQKIIGQQNSLLNNYRKTLNSDIHFENRQDHTFMELLYISYMEPSIEKLSQEWNINVSHLSKILNNEKTHQHYEFDFMKDIYNRAEITKFSPFKYAVTADDIREPNTKEPNYFRSTPSSK